MRFLSRTPSGLSISANHTQTTEPYAILSHTWLPDNEEEVTYVDITNVDSRWRKLVTRLHGYPKLEFCLNQAERDGLTNVWIDTCCINKQDANEMDKAIANMYTYYANAAICYVLLTNVKHASWQEDFTRSRWFKRGWTLQELIAPEKVCFYSQEGSFLGTKQGLHQAICLATGNNYQARLRVTDIPAEEIPGRFSWCLDRETTEPADQWYCMLGILDVNVTFAAGKKADDVRSELIRQIKEKYGSRVEESVWRVYHNWQYRHAVDSKLYGNGLEYEVAIRTREVHSAAAIDHAGRNGTLSYQWQAELEGESDTVQMQYVRLDRRGSIRKPQSQPLSRSASVHSAASFVGYRHRRHESSSTYMRSTPRLMSHPKSDPNGKATGSSLWKLHEAVHRDDLTQVTHLLGEGHDVNARDSVGRTALFVAMSDSVAPDIFGQLIKSGANVNVRDYSGMSPLTWLCKQQVPFKFTKWYAKLLLDRGADLTPDSQGIRPFHMAFLNGLSDVIDLIMRRPPLETNFKFQRDVELFRLADPCPHSASQLKDMLALLIKHGANIQRRELNTGRMPIHYACAEHKNIEYLDILLEAKCDVNVKDHQGYTPLHLACEYGPTRLVKSLLDHGADIHERSPRGKLPEEIARDAHAVKAVRARNVRDEETWKTHNLLKQQKMQPRRVVLHDAG